MLRSRFIRLAIVMAVVPTVIMIMVGTLTYKRMHTQHTSAYDLRLNDEIAILATVYSASGEEALLQLVLQRMTMYPTLQDQITYGIFIKQENILNDKFAFTQATNGFMEDDLQRFRITPLDADVSIAIGTSTTGRSRALATLTGDLLFAVLVCLVVSAVLGFLSARGFASRLKAVNTHIDAVGNGNIKTRLPIDQSNDEITFLSNRINTMLERIAHLVKVRKRISDQVAHEVRTPLTQLDNVLQQMLDKVGGPDQILHVKADLNNCVSLLEGLLDVSALEAQIGDKQGFDIIDLSASAKHIAEFYEAVALEKNITLKYELSKGATIFADKGQIERLLANLLDNAIKYTSDGGDVNIKTEHKKDTVYLYVSDTGNGIKMVDRDNIFEPFFRHANHPQIKGHGLGLSLAKAISDRHDAIISVNDNPQRNGTTFQVAFNLMADNSMISNLATEK